MAYRKIEKQQGLGSCQRHDREWHSMQRKARKRLGFFSFLIRIRMHWRIMLCYLLEHRSSLEEHSVSWSTLNSFYHTTVQTKNHSLSALTEIAHKCMPASRSVRIHTHTHTHTLKKKIIRLHVVLVAACGIWFGVKPRPPVL